MQRLIAGLIGLLVITAACSGPNTTESAADIAGQNPTQGVVAETDTSDPSPEVAETSTASATTAPEQQTATPTESAPTATDAPTTTPSATPTSSPTPSPAEPTAKPEAESPQDYRLISYYGHPSTGTMGILGEYDKETLLALLQEQAAAYEAVDPNTRNILAFEIIATVAQPWPGDDGTYVLYTGDEWIGEYVDFATANGLDVILDLQIGHNSIANEIDRVRHWLALPNVHVALDPEFSTGPDRIPGEFIGEVDGHDVNTAIKMVSDIVAEYNLPSKIVMVHQFETEMIYNKDVIVTRPGVDFVLDMDGFGSPGPKLENYDIFVRQQLIEYGGIKMFYQQDDPLLDPATIVSLDPAPLVVIYQ